ncbi:MAG: methyltransferase domain-containing protein [Pseudonocardiaceae bacterium]|nr:methyltransferase domain-containing protein [Pseudonocardiaceae bacterium]
MPPPSDSSSAIPRGGVSCVPLSADAAHNSASVAPGGTGYVFDNDSFHAHDQHRCLAEMLDPMTINRLSETGVADGWRCLEVGAGGGSVAVWLAQQVAPSGTVLATDVKPRHIPQTAGLEVTQHDIVTDPLPQAAFDLIHARLVLLHLPERRSVLHRLVRALRPGGWLQLDEFDITYGPALLMPDQAARELYERFLAAKARMFRAAGADGAWGKNAPQAMHDFGLIEIDPAVSLQTWRAESAGVGLLLHHTFHLRDKLIAAGMTDRQLEDIRRLLTDPSFMAISCPIYSIQGRRPPSGGHVRLR